MRNKRLDVLRGIAVLLVIFYHGTVHNRVFNAGWMGVDLFFVLSGFLISGLLFVEYKKTQSISFKRFFIRRGLKIYPAFYIFLFLTFVAEKLFHHVRPVGAYLSEIFYVQNYGPALWPHIWSLAVEEHFYILLPLFLLVLLRFPFPGTDPFRLIPGAFLFVALACIAFRFVAVMPISADKLSDWDAVKSACTLTHQRMDALFFGVLLRNLSHFRKAVLDNILVPARNRIVLGVMSAICLSLPILLANHRRFLIIVGYTLVYLAFGAILMLILRAPSVLPRSVQNTANILGKGFASLGRYSYSIYLWHLPVLRWCPIFINEVFHFHPSVDANYASYLALSIGFGALMSRLIEYPILAVRDRLIPSANAALGRKLPVEFGQETEGLLVT